MICPPACRARHDHDVSGTEKDGHGFLVSSRTANEENSSATKPNEKNGQTAGSHRSLVKHLRNRHKGRGCADFRAVDMRHQRILHFGDHAHETELTNEGVAGDMLTLV